MWLVDGAGRLLNDRLCFFWRSLKVEDLWEDLEPKLMYLLLGYAEAKPPQNLSMMVPERWAARPSNKCNGVSHDHQRCTINYYLLLMNEHHLDQPVPWHKGHTIWNEVETFSNRVACYSKSTEASRWPLTGALWALCCSVSWPQMQQVGWFQNKMKIE